MHRFLAVFPFVCFFLPVYSQPTLTALTYNIRYDNPGDGEDAWPKRRDFLAGQLRFHAPDIFGIQEGLHRQVEYLSEQLPAYTRVGVGRDDGKEGGEYSALFFLKKRFGLLASGTFWLSETPDTVSKGWDAALPRICTFAHLHDSLSGKKLWVFNTHFDHIGKEARRRSAELILWKIKEKNTAGEPVILMGDLNAEPQEEPIAVLIRTLRDARSVSEEPPFGPEGTFNAFKFHDPVQRRIDYIFLNDTGLKVKQHAVLSDSRDCHYPSDHLPVLARLAWR
ncbi:MAG TPA: endonuclease/exonuclease/phosphatase family protein [Saprospiraceae bacterium]|nr:endonuclease/exonuclease/phosphatase family protein [Saprospiraceae bacterium]